MFCYQPNYFSQTETMTAELFTQLTVSDNVVNRIRQYRQQLPELERLKQEVKEREARDARAAREGGDARNVRNARNIRNIRNVRNIRDVRDVPDIRDLKRQMQAITRHKTGLPTLMYQAAEFAVTTSKKGYDGRWRSQRAVRLNGFFILDIDHVEDPRALFLSWCGEATMEAKEQFCSGKAIVLVHVTPSGHGLRIVAMADAATGNIADNQQALAKSLGVELDEACKDASRCSFCPMLEDILFINTEKLFNYENPEFDKMFGEQYRGGNSRPAAARSKNSADRGGNGAAAAGNGGGTRVPVAGQAPAVGTAADGGDDELDGRLREGYHGKSYEDIVKAWFAANGGTPKAGDRHQTLYRMACDLRYITDFSPQLLAKVIAQCQTGKDVTAERGQAEIDRIASDACALQRYRTVPKRMQEVLQSIGIQLSAGGADGEAKPVPQIDYDAWYRRLEPLLSGAPVLQEAVVTLPDRLKLAGVLAAGAMLGTYLTRCWWTHFDGKKYRLSFLVYIIGDAASGKSFVTEMDRLIMTPMLAADAMGREWERQYKEEMKKRSASSKNAKAEAPEQQHPCIRYVPSSISNAMLYRRLTDAVDHECAGPDGHTPVHLHCYTMEAELATALRAQQGSWAGKNDLELKSFHNEYAGVDFANDQSTNGIIQVNWNQVVTGTPESMGRKIKPAMVLDGLVTRLVLFPMPNNDFQMIERREFHEMPERDTMLRTAGLKLDQVKGELKVKRLVDFCYDYESKLTEEAKMENDLCLDYFRKRIPVIMMRYALVRVVLRQLEDAIAGKPLTVTDDDLEFARLIGDWCLMAQMHFYGDMVMEAQQKAKLFFVPRRRSFKVREAYAALPKEFTRETLVSLKVAKDIKAAGVIISRWINDGLIKPKMKAFTKMFDEIPV